jgi:integrase
MEVSFYLKRANGKQSSAIYARICYHGLKLKYYPSFKINPKYWNAEKQRARAINDFPGHKNFNRSLDNVVRHAEDLLREYQNDNDGKIPSKENLKELLDAKIKNVVKDAVTFLSFFQQVIDDTESGVRFNEKTGKPINEATIKTYKTIYNHLIQFQNKKRKRIDFVDITGTFNSDYKRYLVTELKFATNTIGKHIQIIKLVMEDARKKKLHTNLDYQSFTVTREDVDAIYLNETELKALEAIDLSDQPTYQNVRDLILVGCYTGLRYSDFSVLEPSSIKGGYIEITQIKTGDEVVIPVHDVVSRIIEKYGGNLPQAYSNQKMNEYIKLVAEKAVGFDQKVTLEYTKGGQKLVEVSEKWELISTHTARRSFATNEFIAGTPPLTIMAITGHKTETAFMRYIRVTNREKAELMKLDWDRRQEQNLLSLKGVS